MEDEVGMYARERCVLDMSMMQLMCKREREHNLSGDHVFWIDKARPDRERQSKRGWRGRDIAGDGIEAEKRCMHSYTR